MIESALVTALLVEQSSNEVQTPPLEYLSPAFPQLNPRKLLKGMQLGHDASDPFTAKAMKLLGIVPSVRLTVWVVSMIPAELGAVVYCRFTVKPFVPKEDGGGEHTMVGLKQT